MRTSSSIAVAAVWAAGCSGQASVPAETSADVTPEVTTVDKPLAEIGLSSEAIDRSVDPCDDFYQFACGGWIDATPIPADESRWIRSFNVINRDNRQLLSDLLKQAAAEPAGDAVMTRLGAYYGACMDTAAADAAGLAPVQPLMKAIRGVRRRSDVSKAIMALHRHGIWAPWDISAVQDFKEATSVIAFMDQNGLGLPDRDYYFDEDKKEILAAYREHVAKMLTLGGVPKRRVPSATKVIVDMETRLAKASLTRVERRDPYNLYHKIDRVGLADAVPSFPWDRYFVGLGHSELKDINVSHVPFFAEVETMLKTTKPADWRVYLTWHVLRATAPSLSTDLDEASFAFEQVLTGQEEQKPRWKRCVNATDVALGELLAQPYVDRRFAGQSKTDAEGYVAAIGEAFRRSLPDLPWMDEAARKTAEEKLEKVAYLIGYPNDWDRYDFEIGKVYGANWLAARRWHVADDLDQIGKPLDRGRWEMTPPTVNAYYHPLKNQMVFPAGILQPPFYSVSASVPVNLGAMGMVVGHELTHGFDDQGSKFDGDGNLRAWWSEEVATSFQTETQCIVDQYEGYEPLPGLNLNGKLTLGENIADNGGVKLAFQAYRALREGAAARVVAEGFDEDQQFFLATAQIWCGKVREAEARRRVQNDPHSPPRFRVNGSLANLPAFGEAFSCEAGSPMRPEKVCSVW